MLEKEVYFNKNYEAIEFCKKFESKDNEVKRYVLGRNAYAQFLASKLYLDGYIDDYTEDKEFKGVKILKTQELPENSMVVVCSLDRIKTVSKKLKELKIYHLDYYAFYKYTSLKLRPIEYWNGFENDYKVNFEEYQNIYSQLRDDDSKNTLNKLINFRLAYDVSFMSDFSFRIDKQYFESFLNIDDDSEAVFADVGAYDGQTTIEFIKRYPNYSSVHLFEPDYENYKIAECTLENYKNIHIHNKGLSNKKDKLKFECSLGQSSKVSDSGEDFIDVDRFDNIVSSVVTFIKMDIEGAEKEAIEGMTSSILKYHPVMAIAVYHRFDDFWKIPKLILSIRSDYNLFLRHYTEGLGETVMYFVPRGSNL